VKVALETDFDNVGIVSTEVNKSDPDTREASGPLDLDQELDFEDFGILW
jgi:hypothetical protein